MKRKTISVRLETRKKRKDADLDVDQWQIAYIREGNPPGGCRRVCQ
jgi:hypothetical protein